MHFMFLILVLLLGVVLFQGRLFAARPLDRADGRLRLKEVARARGLALPHPRTEAAMDAAALARLHCLACRRQARCDDLAAARDWAALRAICPNTRYIDRLRAG